MKVDPELALAVDMGFKTHIRPKTISSYGTGARSYVQFMESRSLRPWPVTPVEYCGWLHTLPPRVQVPSMRVYKAGVRDASILEGHGWPMEGNEFVRRTMRFLERKFPSKPKGQKVPITVGVLYKILPLLDGWPDMSCMSAEDRVFAAASVIGLSGFLRGGEFLESKQSDRDVLLAMDVCLRLIGDRDAVVVLVRQPKTRPWLSTVAVPCFGNVFNDAFCPVRLWREYWSRCPEFGTKGVSSPAFVLKGKPLSRDYMVTRTTSLMIAANVSFIDQKGDRMSVKAASWRSGAVCSAVQAGVPAQNIMFLGRWTSEAWKNYLLQAPSDLQGAACSMWADTSLRMVPATSGLLVAEFDVSGFFAPHIACDINSMLSVLGIDVNGPSSS
jgi:hypothetical protein